jgi:hypothetical protein
VPTLDFAFDAQSIIAAKETKRRFGALHSLFKSFNAHCLLAGLARVQRWPQHEQQRNSPDNSLVYVALKANNIREFLDKNKNHGMQKMWFPPAARSGLVLQLRTLFCRKAANTSAPRLTQDPGPRTQIAPFAPCANPTGSGPRMNAPPHTMQRPAPGSAGKLPYSAYVHTTRRSKSVALVRICCASPGAPACSRKCLGRAATSHALGLCRAGQGSANIRVMILASCYAPSPAPWDSLLGTSVRKSY